MTSPLPHVLRLGSEADLNLILHSWVQEMRHSLRARHVPDDVFFPAQRAEVLGLLRVSTVTIACAPDEPDHVYGYAVHGPEVLHWLYVKSAFRGLGLARILFEAAGSPSVTTAESRKGASLFAKFHVTYNPYLLSRSELRP